MKILVNGKIIRSVGLILLLGFICSCKKNERPEDKGQNDSINPDVFRVSKLDHPGILHDKADLQRIKMYVANGLFPPYNSYLALKSLPTASATYQIRGPFANIARDGVDGNTKGAFEQDFNAAYHNSLMWVITGNEAHAKKAIEILNAYSNTLTGITGSNDNALTASFGGFILVNAAEIMRYTYSNWTLEDINKCEIMFRNVFVKELNVFFARPAYTNGNWGVSAMKAMMGFGVFLNDIEIFNKAVEFFFSKDIDNGSLYNYVINTEGQCQESGRDQAHTMLGLGSMAEACEVGFKQGLDMYGAMNNRLMYGYEYTSKYNLGYTVPYVKWKDVTGKYSNWGNISEAGRGIFRPIFEIAYNHYVVRKKLSMPFTQEVITKVGAEAAAPACDNPGFGSLLFYIGPTQLPDVNLGKLNCQFNGTDREGWNTVQTGASSIVADGKLKVSMVNVGTTASPKYRGDIALAKPNLNPINFPIWAIKFNKPGNSVLTLDARLATLSGQGTGLVAKDGTSVFYWDLSSKFSDIFQPDLLTLKVADMTVGTPNYEVDWIMTFKDINDLNTYINQL